MASNLSNAAILLIQNFIKSARSLPDLIWTGSFSRALRCSLLLMHSSSLRKCPPTPQRYTKQPPEAVMSLRADPYPSQGAVKAPALRICHAHAVSGRCSLPSSPVSPQPYGLAATAAEISRCGCCRAAPWLEQHVPRSGALSAQGGSDGASRGPSPPAPPLPDSGLGGAHSAPLAGSEPWAPRLAARRPSSSSAIAAAA